MTAEKRQKLVATALWVTHGASIAPGEYELYLLDKFVQGMLAIDEVIILLEAVKEYHTPDSTRAPEQLPAGALEAKP